MTLEEYNKNKKEYEKHGLSFEDINRSEKVLSPEVDMNDPYLHRTVFTKMYAGKQ